MCMGGLLPLSQTTSPWNPSPRRTWQTHQPICSTCYCTSRATITPSATTPVRKWPCSDTRLVQSTSWTWHPAGHCHPPCSPVPREEGSIPTSLCEQPWDAHCHWHDHHWLAQWHQGSSVPVTPLLATSWNPHHWRWHCPMWRSPHCPSIRKGEDATTTPPIPSRNHQSLVVHTWMCLLARHKQSHRRNSSAVWDLHWVPSPKCCSIPHSYANSVPPMADVCYRHLYLRRNWVPDMWRLLFKDDPCPMSSIQPEQHCQSCLTAQRNVLRAWNSWSTLLWQWPSVCTCTVH